MQFLVPPKPREAYFAPQYLSPSMMRHVPRVPVPDHMHIPAPLITSPVDQLSPFNFSGVNKSPYNQAFVTPSPQHYTGSAFDFSNSPHTQRSTTIPNCISPTPSPHPGLGFTHTPSPQVRGGRFSFDEKVTTTEPVVAAEPVIVSPVAIRFPPSDPNSQPSPAGHHGFTMVSPNKSGVPRISPSKQRLVSPAKHVHVSPSASGRFLVPPPPMHMEAFMPDPEPIGGVDFGGGGFGPSIFRQQQTPISFPSSPSAAMQMQQQQMHAQAWQQQQMMAQQQHAQAQQQQQHIMMNQISQQQIRSLSPALTPVAPTFSPGITTAHSIPLATPASASAQSSNSMSLASQRANEREGTSCHQCKIRKVTSELVFCTRVYDMKTRRVKRKCMKKFCTACLQRCYNQTVDEEQAAVWCCPCCRKVCTCASCKRKSEKRSKKQALEGSATTPTSSSATTTPAHSPRITPGTTPSVTPSITPSTTPHPSPGRPIVKTEAKRVHTPTMAIEVQAPPEHMLRREEPVRAQTVQMENEWGMDMSLNMPIPVPSSKAVLPAHPGLSVAAQRGMAMVPQSPPTDHEPDHTDMPVEDERDRQQREAAADEMLDAIMTD